jgi:hypothetical protein
MNIGAAVHEVPVHLEGDPSASSPRARAGRRRVIDLEPIPPVKAKTAGQEDTAPAPVDYHRGRIIDLRV